MYWHTLIVHDGTRARFLNNNISRFESAFRCNCCHRCGSLSYSTMKSIDTSYTMNPCLSVPDKTIHKHTLTHYGKQQFLHDDHTGNNNYNDNCNDNDNCNCNYNYNENEYENENDNDNNDLFDCNNDISNEVYYILCDGCFYFLNDIVGSTDKMSSMTYLYFTSKHTHPLRKTNYYNNPIHDCDKLYSNIQGEIPLSQNKMLMTSIPTFREKFSSLRTRCL